MLLLATGYADAQVLDTALELKKLVHDFKSFRNLGYDYVMDASFPNGEKDHFKGTSCLDNDDKLYFNDCDAFTILYTGHWFYKADHRKKTLVIVNLDKDNNKKLKATVEKDIFQNGAAITFLDSVVSKKAKIKKFQWSGDTLKVTLGFPQKEITQRIDIAYDTVSHLLASYSMTVDHPWQNTPKGIQVIETKIKCSDFKKITDKSEYEEENFFSYKNAKIELKKYNDYKLSDKM